MPPDFISFTPDFVNLLPHFILPLDHQKHNIMSLTLNKNFEIKAPVSAVWKALTDPAIIKQYFFGTNVISEWKEGTPIVFRGEWEGQTYEDKGTILKIIPEKLFKYNYYSSWSDLPDLPENYSIISYRLEAEGDTTLFHISQDGIADQGKLADSEKNWATVIQNMKDLLEKKDTW